MSFGLANTPLINYFFYKQSTFVSSVVNTTTFPVLAVADAGNGQLLITTDDTSLLTVGVAVTIESTASYNGNFTVISLTATTFNISGTFGISETGTWKLASNLTGANVGDPLDFGQVFFFDNGDKITPLDTFSDRGLTVANTNPIVLDAVGSVPPIYMFDQPYFIKIIDKFNNLVATLDNYVPAGATGGDGAELPIGNLLSNYGFDTRINENIFSEVSVAAVSTNAVSAGWFWEISTTEVDPQNTYEYIELGNSNLIGNPKNELILKSTNNTTGQTVNQLYTVLGDYNKFQESVGTPLTLTFSIFTRLQSGAPTSIPLTLVRLKQGIPQTPIAIGSVNIDTLRTQEFQEFTVPDLTTSAFDNDDELRLVLTLPLNTDFQFAFTGTWLQLGTEASVSITEDAGSADAAKEFFGQSFRQLQANPQFPNRGLPIGIGLGGAVVLNETGAIFQAVTADADNFNFAVSMGGFLSMAESVELIRDKLIKNTQTNRLLDFLRDNDYTQSRLTFIPSNVANVVSVGTGIGTPENSPWNSLAAPRITVAKILPDELIHKVSAQALGNGKVRFTFVDNFAPAQLPFNPVYAGAGGASGSFLYPPNNPPNHPIISWVGTASFSFNDNPENSFCPSLGETTINPGSGAEPAVVDILFEDNDVAANFTAQSVSGSDIPVDSLVNYYARLPLYQGAPMGRQFVDSAGVAQLSPTPVFINYLAYNDITLNPATQTDPPPHSIRFPIAGAASLAPAGTISTADVPLELADRASRVAASVVATVNTSFTYEITIVSTPNFGDIVEISNGSTDFNLIFYSGSTRPMNVGAREAIFVQFAGGDTTTQIAEKTVTALERGVMGVPRAADLGLEFSGNAAFPNAPTYFMVL